MKLTPRERPPRHFDLPTRLSLLFGGFYVPFGLFFMLIGSIIMWTMVGMGDWSSLMHPVQDDWVETEARIISVAETNASQNDERVYSYEYSYAVNGHSYVGTAYTTGRKFAQNTQTRIRYDPDLPEHSLMVGARRGTFSFWIVPVVLIFPLAGLGFFLYGFLQNRKGMHLLQHGLFVRATPVDKQATMTQINKQTVYKYRFSFEVAGQAYEAICKTHICGPVEDEETEKILFDPIDPSHNVVYDALSNAPAFDQFGKMVPNSWWKAWPVLLLLAVITVNYVGARLWGLF